MGYDTNMMKTCWTYIEQQNKAIKYSVNWRACFIVFALTCPLSIELFEKKNSSFSIKINVRQTTNINIPPKKNKNGIEKYKQLSPTKHTIHRKSKAL